MAITPCITTAAKLAFIKGEHAAADTYKIALYTSSATLDSTSSAYTATNEVSSSGTNYSAGGATLGSYSASTSSTTAYIDWADPSWATASFTARGCMIYNDSDTPKCSVAVIDFGADYTATAGTFTITFPAAGATAIVRIA